MVIPLLISFSLSIVLIFLLPLGFWFKGFKIGLKFLLTSTVYSTAVGFAVGNILFPVIWLTISYALNGGSIEENLCQGGSVNDIFVALTVGIFSLLAFSVFGTLWFFQRNSAN